MIGFPVAAHVRNKVPADPRRQLVHDPDITGHEIRTILTETPTEGVGVVEAPRGTGYSGPTAT